MVLIHKILVSLSLKLCALWVLAPLGEQSSVPALCVKFILTSEHNYCDIDIFETIVFASLKSHFKRWFFSLRDTQAKWEVKMLRKKRAKCLENKISHLWWRRPRWDILVLTVWVNSTFSLPLQTLGAKARGIFRFFLVLRFHCISTHVGSDLMWM